MASNPTVTYLLDYSTTRLFD